MIQNGCCTILVLFIGNHMATIPVVCTHCQQAKKVIRHGKAKTGHQRYLCKHCNKSFQLEYSYNGNQPGIHERIITMTMNSAGVRDISRILKISPTTVITHLKNSHHALSLNFPLSIPKWKYSVSWMNSGLLLVTRRNKGGCFMRGSPGSRK